MNFRRYQRGDEGAIVEVINRSFSTFRAWGLTPEKWLGYQADPGFKLENAFVAEDDGKIIGHVQVVERELNFGNFVKTAGIANVCTDPDYRKKGAATELMSYVMKEASKRYTIAGLDTGYGSSAHRIYRRVGFSPFHFFLRFSAEKWDAERALRRLDRSSGGMGKAEEFDARYKEDIKRIYAENANITAGVSKRTDQYWEEKLFKRNSWQTFFYRELKPEDLLVLPGRAYSYIDWEEERRRLFVREAMASPGDGSALAEIYAEAIRRRPDANEVVVAAPEGDPLVDGLLADFYRFREGGSYMLSLLNPEGFIRQVGPLNGVSADVVELRLYNDVTSLEAVNVSLKDLTPTDKAADAKLGMHQSTFLRMLTGLLSPLSAIYGGLIDIGGSSSNIPFALISLFPSRRFYLWPSDHW